MLHVFWNILTRLEADGNVVFQIKSLNAMNSKLIQNAEDISNLSDHLM